MKIVVCPGMHPIARTEAFIGALNLPSNELIIIPTEKVPVYSGLHVLQCLPSSEGPFLFLAFSAGVVGAIAAGRRLASQGCEVRALIAIDGWGVPLSAPFPLHRLSHDQFTHWSSALLGTGEENFCADPPVKHLEMWQSPHTVTGYREWTRRNTHAFLDQSRTTAAAFLTELIDRYRTETYSERML